MPFKYNDAVIMRFEKMLGGVHKLRLQDLSFFDHLPPSVYFKFNGNQQKQHAVLKLVVGNQPYKIQRNFMKHYVFTSIISIVG